MRPETFVDPATGVTMRVGYWYVVTDSGSIYSSIGFASPQAAVDHMLKDELMKKAFELSPEDVCVPEFLGADKGWSDLGKCNVLKANNIRDFEMHQQPDYFFDCQKKVET